LRFTLNRRYRLAETYLSAMYFQHAPCTRAHTTLGVTVFHLRHLSKLVQVRLTGCTVAVMYLLYLLLYLLYTL